MEEIEIKAIAKAKNHIASAITQLKSGRKVINTIHALTNLECARSELELILPSRRGRHRKGGDVSET